MLLPFNFKNWINEHRHLLKPPVSNKVLYENADFMIMVVGGPNARKDYHVDPIEEFFYQLEGNMVLRIMVDGKPKDINIKEGDIFLLSKNIPHSPQRFDNSVGLVVEYKREIGELDFFQWYCDECHALLHEVQLQLKDIVKQLPPLFDRFWGNNDARTCKQCSSYLEKP